MAYLRQYLFLFILSGLSFTTQAQDIYASKYATMYITGTLDDSTITAKSKKVNVLLDYATSGLLVLFEKSTLKTGLDSLDEKLSELENEFIQFEGQLDYGLTQVDVIPEGQFRVTGQVSCEEDCEVVEGVAVIKKIGNVYSFDLTMDFTVSLSALKIDPGVDGISDDIRVKILHTIMNRER